jgi:ketosteroid isomerase-like protein
MHERKAGMISKMNQQLGLALCVAAAICLFAMTTASASDERSPAEVLDAFTAAIDAGDRRAALALLTRDVAVFETGAADRSRSDYEGVHLGMDIEFASYTTRVLRSRRQGSGGDLHWITSLYSDQGEINGEATVQMTAETALLRRVGQTWRIAHLHWSNAEPQPQTAN